MVSNSIIQPIIPLGKLLQRARDEIRVQDDVLYKQVTVRLWNKGVDMRTERRGMEIKNKRQFQIHTGQLVLSRIDVRNGAIGLVPHGLDGAIVSNDFWAYEIDHSQINSRFLALYVTTSGFHAAADRISLGTTKRIRANEEAFLEIEIPLPPLSEQRRIVARIEELAAKIEEALRLRREAVEEGERLVSSETQKIIDEAEARGWRIAYLPQVSTINPSRKGQIDLDDSDIVSFVPMAAVDDVTGSIASPEDRPYSDVKKGYTWFIDGDVIFAKITPCMENGKTAVARKLTNGVGFGSTEFHVIRANKDALVPEFVHRLFRRHHFRLMAQASFKGSAGQQRVPKRFLEQVEIPVPSLADQHHIVAYLDDLQARVDELRRLQAETQAELEALMPSVLDRAFRGEL